MRRAHGDVELGKRGGGDGGGDDVGGNRRQPHAQNHAGNHGEHQREQQAGVPEGDDGVGHRQAKASLGTDADDDADDGAGHSHGHGLLRAFGERIQQVAEAHARFRPQHGDGDGDNDGEHRRENDGGAGEKEHVEQEGDGQQQVAAAAQHLAHAGQLLAWHAGQPVLGGAQVHLEDDAEVVKQRRQQRPDDDLRVGHANHLRHDEGRRPHDGRQELAADRGGGFHGASELARVADALHQRDGEGAGGDDVGHGRAIDGAEKARRNDGNLGRSPLGVTGHGQRNVVEELPHAALFHHRAEDDEEEDVAGGDADRRAVDALGVGEEMVGQRRPVIAPVHEHAGEAAPVEAVGDEDEAQNDERLARDAARGLQHQHHEQRRHAHVQAAGGASARDHALIVVPDVKRHGKAQRRQQPVQRAGARAVGAAAEGIHEKAQRQNHRHMQRAVHERGGRAEGGGVEVVGRDQQAGEEEKAPRATGEAARVRLLVQLAHTAVGLLIGQRRAAGERGVGLRGGVICHENVPFW